MLLFFSQERIPENGTYCFNCAKTFITKIGSTILISKGDLQYVSYSVLGKRKSGSGVSDWGRDLVLDCRLYQFVAVFLGLPLPHSELESIHNGLLLYKPLNTVLNTSWN